MTNLDSEISRIATFVKWELSYPSALNLARAGFTYIGIGDSVRCYKCHCVISDWKQNDVPLDRHRHVSPNCSLVTAYSLPTYKSPPQSQIAYPSDDVRLVSRPQNSIHQPSLNLSGKSSPTHLAPAHSQVLKSQATPLQTDVLPTGENLKLESQRLRTFDTWPSSCVNAKDLAKAGFFYTRIGDCVKCAFCNNILKEWEPGDIPFEEHRKHYPQCPFVCGLNVGNRPDHRRIQHDQPMRVMQPQHNTTGAVGGGGRGARDFPPMLETRNSLNFDAKFADVKQRLRSYENVPLPKGQVKEVLAEAGFYYVGPGDSVKCFQCGGVLKKWSEEDDPWTEHAKWFQNCIFLLQVRGYEFINDIQRQVNGSSQPVQQCTETSSQNEFGDEDTMPKTRIEEAEQEESTSLKQEFVPSSISANNPSAAASSSGAMNVHRPVMVTHPSEDPPSSSFSLPPSSTSSLHLKAADEETANMAKENERLKEAIQCKICMDATANTVFMPCGHLLCCEQCAPAIIDCPVCRGIIKATIKVYIA